MTASPPAGPARETPRGAEGLPTPDELTGLLEGRLPGLLGMRVLAASPDAVTTELTIAEHHLAPNGYLHAATVVALADTACGLGTRLRLEVGTRFTTVEQKTNHLGTTRSGVVRAHASVVHSGSRTQVWDARVVDASSDRVIALFRCTQMAL